MGWHSTDGVTACLFSSRVWYFPNEKWAPPDGSGCASSARAEAHLCWGGCRDTQGGFTWVTTQDSSCCAAQEAQLAPAAEDRGSTGSRSRGVKLPKFPLLCQILPTSFLLSTAGWESVGKGFGSSCPCEICSRFALLEGS